MLFFVVFLEWLSRDERNIDNLSWAHLLTHTVFHTIYKWSDFLVFSDKDYKTGGPVSQHFLIICGTLKNSHTVWKRVGDVIPGVVIYLLHGSGGVGEIKYGLTAAARGAFTSWRPISPHRRIVKSHVCCVSDDTFTFSAFLGRFLRATGITIQLSSAVFRIQ